MEKDIPAMGPFNPINSQNVTLASQIFALESRMTLGQGLLSKNWS